MLIRKLEVLRPLGGMDEEILFEKDVEWINVAQNIDQ
jgi:hypothetical protein